MLDESFGESRLIADQPLAATLLMLALVCVWFVAFWKRESGVNSRWPVCPSPARPGVRSLALVICTFLVADLLRRPDAVVFGVTRDGFYSTTGLSSAN